MKKIIIASIIPFILLFSSNIKKIDGNDEWKVKFDVPALGMDEAIKTEDGYVIVSGWPDIWLTKIDKKGNLIWQKCVSSGNWEVPHSIIEVEDGFVIAGDIGLTKSDAFLVKTDKGGEIIWKKTYGEENVDEFGRRVIKATNGFLLIGAKNDGTWVIKTDEEGNEIWNKTYFEKEGGWGADAIKIEDGYFIVGIYGWSIVLIKIDEEGNEIWNKTYSRGAYEAAARIIKIEGGYLIGGGDISTSFLLKIDNEGDIIWYCSYGGADVVFINMVETEDGYVVVGRTGVKTIGNIDGLSLKVDKNRGDRIIWVKNFGGRGGDELRSIFLENKSYILLGNEEIAKDKWEGIIIKCADYLPPEINISRPRENYLYIFDREIMPYSYTLIIGKITIVVDVYNPSNAEIKRIEFYIDKKEYTWEPVKVLYSPPYEFTIDFPIFGWIELTAGLYYGGCEGVVAKHREMRIIKLI